MRGARFCVALASRGQVLRVVGQIHQAMCKLQIVGLSCMLFRWPLPILPGFQLPVFEIGIVLTVIAAALTLWSAVQYLRAAWPDLRGHS